MQGDAILVELMQQFGVQTTFNETGVLLTKTASKLESFEYDFSDCPDIAQTLMVLCAALNIKAKLTGLETLTIKETDRLAAPKTELEKLGCDIAITSNTFIVNKGINNTKQKPTILTYDDHRMAMAFAPLGFLFDEVTIENHEVVNKSYPSFWVDMKKLGLEFK